MDGLFVNARLASLNDFAGGFDDNALNGQRGVRGLCDRKKGLNDKRQLLRLEKSKPGIYWMLQL
jgi:hypothetical protein